MSDDDPINAIYSPEASDDEPAWLVGAIMGAVVIGIFAVFVVLTMGIGWIARTGRP